MNDKKIPVWFRYYDTRGVAGISVTHITADAADKLIDMLDNAQPCAHDCMRLVSVQYYRTKFLDTAGNVPSYRSLVLNRPRYPFNLTQDGRILPRGICMKRARSDWGTAIKQCIDNMATGKCLDEYVCNTIGAALYPQLYGNKKER